LQSVRLALDGNAPRQSCARQVQHIFDHARHAIAAGDDAGGRFQRGWSLLRR